MGIENLALITAKRAWITVFAWIILIVLSGFLIFRYLNSSLTTNQNISVPIESDKAEQLIEDRLGDKEQSSEIIIVQSSKYSYTDSEFRDYTLNLQKELTDLGKEKVESNFSFYQTQNRGLVSDSGKSVLIIANLTGNMDEAHEKIEDIRSVVEENRNDDFSVYEAGVGSVNQDFQEVAESDLTRAEIIGLPIALVILILVFGAVVSAVLPMSLSFLAIGLAMAASAVLGQFSPLSFFVTNMITMMGLAVGIDYSLFIMSRFREERSHGVEKIQAITNSGKTAGKAVFFSGITVVIALSGLLLIPSNIFRSLAIGAIFVVIAAVLAAITLLPALLSLFGDRINWLSIPFIGGKPDPQGHKKGFWSFISRNVMSTAWFTLPIAAGFLIWATIPLSAIKIGQSGVTSLPAETSSKAGFEILENEFSAGLLSPAKIVIDADVQDNKIKDSITKLETDLKNNSLISSVTTQTYPNEKLAVMDVAISASDDEASNVVKEIRSDFIPDAFDGTGAQVYVGGQEAGNLDFIKIVNDNTPIVFGLVLTLSFLLLMLVFRSIIVPIKAIIMNLLSVGAAYGLLVLVFQYGVGNEFFGFSQSPQIEAWIPLFLFAILFGLSMDYHVFLLSRIRERFNQTGDNTEAVGFGLSTTGRLITGAALIMVAVFAAFAAGRLVMFQQVGFGLAVSILLDATIVRSILVPASMKLLGNWNWYLPSWLNWLPKIGIEE